MRQALFAALWLLPPGVRGVHLNSRRGQEDHLSVLQENIGAVEQDTSLEQVVEHDRDQEAWWIFGRRREKELLQDELVPNPMDSSRVALRHTQSSLSPIGEPLDQEREAVAQPANWTDSAVSTDEQNAQEEASTTDAGPTEKTTADGFEGVAGPAVEESEVAEHWSFISGTPVTFSYSTHCDIRNGCRTTGAKRGQPSFQEMYRNVISSIRALRFCFSDVFIVLDVPHESHNKAGPETPGNVTSHRILPPVVAAEGMMLNRGEVSTKFEVDLGLRSAAVSTAKAAAELLRGHCAGAQPSWRVKVLDYSSEEMRERALTHYAIEEEDQKTDYFSRMYANTMALDQNFRPQGRYIFHLDAQWRIYRSNFSPKAPNFVQKAIALMRADERVYLASLVATHNLEPQHNPYNRFAEIPGSVHQSQPVERLRGMLQGWAPQAWMSAKRPLRGEAFAGNWSAEEGKKIGLYKMVWDSWGGIVTRHQFVMDVERFRGLFPLKEWDTAAEHMWAANMNYKQPDWACQVYFNETVGVFSGPSEK